MASLHNGHVVAQPLHLAQGVTREKHGVAIVSPVPQKVHQFILDQWIEATCRLVKHQ